MRLSRYVSRRAVRALQYGGLCGIVVMIVLGLRRDRSEPESRFQPVFPGDAHNAPSQRQQQQQGAEEKPKSGSSVMDASQNLGPPPGDPAYTHMKSERDWHDYAVMEADKKRSGNGENGAPYALPKDEETKKKQDALYRVNGFDGLASDQISLNRSLKDLRHPACSAKKYLPKLPSVTVIFPFHNEHNSTLLRSVHSVINRSPPGIVREIILVDDASTKDFLKQPLEDYLRRNAPIVKVVRCPKREGLIRARQVGAQHATQDVMIFLDSHSEPAFNWIPPLVEPIALDYKTVVCPFVDVIDCDTFEYRIQDNGARGSFDWEFNYKRLPITPEDQKEPTKPFKSPVMAGGYFAISRKWFWELGGYDEGLDIWGGEQYELSFKVWQCHGQMFDAPCSRVGHIYRCKYVPFPNPGVGDFISRNYKRVAEVWMDEYAEHLYKRRPGMRNTDTRDLSKQKAVRERLKCKSFDWFMKEIAFDQDKFYPAVEPPDGAKGEIRMVGTDQCVDTQFKGKEDRFGLRKCIKDSPAGGGEQTMRFSFWKDIRAGGRSMCWDVSTSIPKAPIVLFPCHGMQGNQAWKWKPVTKQIFHPLSSQCLDADKERGELFMNPCNPDKETQKWTWEGLDQSVIDKWKY